MLDSRIYLRLLNVRNVLCQVYGYPEFYNILVIAYTYLAVILPFFTVLSCRPVLVNTDPNRTLLNEVFPCPNIALHKIAKSHNNDISCGCYGYLHRKENSSYNVIKTLLWGKYDRGIITWQDSQNTRTTMSEKRQHIHGIKYDCKQ